MITQFGQAERILHLGSIFWGGIPPVDRGDKTNGRSELAEVVRLKS